MNAMMLERIHDLRQTSTPLTHQLVPIPTPGPEEILIRVAACGVCHTELDEIEGRTPPPHFPVILGHEVVGRVESTGPGADRFPVGARVGVAWINHACGRCDYCRDGLENLCAEFAATGRDAHGGYAEYMTVNQAFAFPIPDRFSDVQAAPLLCAGAIGYRSMSLCQMHDGQRLGLTGFGASAHLVLKMVKHQFPNSPVYVFARSPGEQAFARSLGAVWAGHTKDRAPQPLDCIIDTTPAWTPVVAAMENLKPGGRLVINAIRKETFDRDVLLTLDYSSHLWHEKEIKSVANVARSDVSCFLTLADQIPIIPEVQTFALKDANQALMELKNRKIRGGKVLVMDPDMNCLK
ncbi:alcohol dehydrogenase [Desulfosarcina variabilis str. Montpellier]